VLAVDLPAPNVAAVSSHAAAHDLEASRSADCLHGFEGSSHASLAQWLLFYCKWRLTSCSHL